MIVSFVYALYTCSCVFETNNCACFSKKYAHNYLTQTCIVHINVHIILWSQCTFSDFHTLFLFVLLFKYKIIDFGVYRSFTVVSKIVQSNFVLFTAYSLVTGVFCLVLSFKPKPLLLLFWKFLKWKFSFTAGVTGNVQGMERVYEALGLTWRNGEPRLQQFGKKTFSWLYLPIYTIMAEY